MKLKIMQMDLPSALPKQNSTVANVQHDLSPLTIAPSLTWILGGILKPKKKMEGAMALTETEGATAYLGRCA